MKSERRHELHTNILATWVSQAIEAAKPQANTILAVVLLLVVVIAGVTLWRRHSSGGVEQAWDAFNHAMEVNRESMYANPAAFEKLTEEYARTDMAPWAALTAADLFLQQGCEQVLRDKGAANQLLQKAQENYTLVLSQTQVDSLREQATFGLARTYEALSGTRRAENELQKAIDNYESVVKNWPQGAYAGLASHRLQELRLPETKQFYDKLAQYDPKPVFADTPGAPGQGLNLGSVPQEPGKKSGDAKSADAQSGDAKSGDAKSGASTSKPPAVPKSSAPPAAPEKASAPPPTPKTTPAAPAKKPADKPVEPAPAKSK